MFHHHHQSHNVDSNNDKYLTPIRDVDENEMEFDDDDDGDENERNDQNDQYADFVIKMMLMLASTPNHHFTIYFHNLVHQQTSLN